MMRLEFTAARWQADKSGVWLAIRATDAGAVKRFIAEKKDKKYVADIKEHRPRRSLDANAYFWALIGKLSAKISIPPEKIYREMIRDVGGNYEVFPVRNEAVEAFGRIWESRGLGWLAEVIGESKLDGYTNMRLIYGSSAYDTAQMSRLLDIAVEECKAQGVEHLPPEKLAALKEVGHETDITV